MIEFGKTLREAREAAGLTISQLAANTRLLHQTIEDLEVENFSRIAAPIYGRGFVKLYCEAVGLDPKPLVDAFMEIFTGSRAPVIRMQEVQPVNEAAAPAEVSQPSLAGLASEEPAAQPTRIVRTVPTPEPPPVAPVPRILPEENEGPDIPPVAPAPRLTPRNAPADIVHAAPRTANPRPVHDIAPEGEPVAPAVPPPTPIHRPRFQMPELSKGMPSLPTRLWRPIALLAAAVVIIVLVVLGIKGIYSLATRPSNSAKKSPAVRVEKTPTVHPTNGQLPAPTKRKPVPVPALFID